MSDLQAKLAALPTEPTMPHMSASDGVWGDYYYKKILRDALLIALAVEWIEKAGHAWNCETRTGHSHGPCTCERDALLKKLEGPR